MIPRWPVVLAFSAAGSMPARAEGPSLPPAPVFYWSADARDAEPDTYVAFRGTWEQAGAAEVEIRLLGAAWFAAWLDGEFLAEGPARFPAAFPEYAPYRARLAPGRHVLAVQVHHIGAPTRMLENLPPFLYAAVLAEGREASLRWKCARLDGYAPRVRRINPQLGWIEWCDTRRIPDWRPPGFDDGPWKEPAAVARPQIGPLAPLSAAAPRAVPIPLRPAASGRLVESFGYEQDNPPARFFLRDLEPARLPPQGVWRRYDLGRVRLARPRFTIDAPPGAVIEFALAESLTRGRVAPWITLSAGDSCNLDHHVARGGPQEFEPVTPKGGRFLEVHVLAPPDAVRFLREEAVERAGHGEPDGAFHSGDDLLDRIWSVGVETHRACSEDALVDNPTRERGQWAGDVVTVGMDIAAAAYNDLRSCRRGLVMCARCARADGLVSGMCPGQDIFLSTYAAQWVSACVRYVEITGDRSLLEELFPAAERNLGAFERQLGSEGVKDALGWGFVDWGYVRNPGPSDMAVNLHTLAALRDMRRWCGLLGRADRADHYRGLDEAMTALLTAYFDGEFRGGGDAWDRIGYHRAALGLRLGFFRDGAEKDCVAFLKAHMLRCFPNDPAAPRLSDPAANHPRLITPYFAYYALPPLLERGEADFVLGQYRACWGWALEEGRTTWLEVFDPRWSLCHQWAGSPTWQLSRYVLGLHPRQDLGPRHFAVSLKPGALRRAEGRVPIGGTDAQAEVRWRRGSDGIAFSLTTPVPLVLHLDPGTDGGTGETVPVERRFERVFPGR